MTQILVDDSKTERSVSLGGLLPRSDLLGRLVRQHLRAPRPNWVMLRLSPGIAPVLIPTSRR